MESLKSGIYFNLSNEDYHNDPAISCSGIKNLLDCPTKYWWNSSLNPKKEQLDTRALRIGKLYHNLLLEPEKFEDEFLVLPKGKLVKSFLKEKSLSEEDIAHLTQIREPDILEAQEAVNEIKENPFYNNWFDGGYPEVSIFWRDLETGLMCRCRFDYLNMDFAVDYKTTQDVTDIKKSVANYSYNLQSAIYLRGLASLIVDDNLFISGNDEQKKWFKSFKENLNGNFKFRFLFQEKTAPYISRSITLASDILEPSIKAFEKGLSIYLDNFNKYGTDKWASGFDKLEEITLYDMPSYWGIKLEEQILNQ
jgi:exodeoxyribonuclease VIII